MRRAVEEERRRGRQDAVWQEAVKLWPDRVPVALPRAELNVALELFFSCVTHLHFALSQKHIAVQVYHEWLKKST